MSSQRYITLHPQYFLNEGFGTLMSHYAVLYSLYRDMDIKPVILDINFKSQNIVSAMQGFNNIFENIIYHSQAFINFDKIFVSIKENYINNYKWAIENLSGFSYNQIVDKINKTNNNICCVWTLSSELTNKYLNDIINYLYIFDDNIIKESRKTLQKTNKDIVGVCVRNEYKKHNYPHPHTRLSLDFYIEAMKQFDCTNCRYLVFSDDINESKKMFNSIENRFDLSYTTPMQSAIGLCSLSLCDHVICANSGFSYWASILNKNPNKKIVCATNFIDKNKDKHLAETLNYTWYPKEWIALDIC